MITKMKFLCALCLGLCLCFNVSAATWIIHGAPDNWLCAWFWDGHTNWEMQWDLDYDLAYPDYPDSGIGQNYELWTGYADVLTLAVKDTSISYGGILCRPFPYYDLGGNFDPLLPGEYWIDFSEVGTVRVETSESYDFGKWSGDGSINPRWVDPLTPSPGKRLAKGHKK